MEWIDTHAHVFEPSLLSGIDVLLEAAHAAGIVEIYLPNLNQDSLSAMEAVEHHPQLPAGLKLHACLGLHPCYVEAEWEKALSALESAWARRDFVAVGETGLDAYHQEGRWEKEQEQAFLCQCAWAEQRKRPLILHGRGRTSRLLSLLKGLSLPAGGVFHCFSGSYKEAQCAIDLGFYLGIGGVLTYKGGATLRDVVKRVPISALVLETDSPYLSPVGAPSRKNQPAYLPFIAKILAKVLGRSLEDISTHTTENARRLFSAAPSAAAH